MDTPIPDEGKQPSKLKWIIATAIVVMVIASVVVVVYEEQQNKGPAQVSFYTWWATEGKIAVNKEYAAFHSAYPNLTAASELKAGAGGSAAKGEILTLIKDGSPPMAFQTHYGPEMLSYIEAASSHSKEFTNTTSVTSSMKNIIPEVLAAGEYNGTSFSLPVDMHRGAELYINPNLLYNNSITKLPQNVSQLLHDTQILNSSLNGGGFTLPGGDGGWDQMQVWEDFFLANSINTTGNATLYDELMYGTLNMSNPTVSNIVNETNSNYLTAYGERAPGMGTLTWTSVIHDVTGSKSGFQANGNWYVNYAYDYLNVTAYPENANTMNTSYDHSHNINLIAMPFPGTQGYFALVTDSVAVPVGSNAAHGLTFAKFFSSYQGQKVFTKYKASTFYNNITSPSFYNTPSQWGDYQAALNASGNYSRWVYQLSDGGLFDSQASSFETALQSLTSTSSVSHWENSLGSIVSSEKASWVAGNNLSLGFMGTHAHPFGNYLPPWVANGSGSAAVTPQNAAAPNHVNPANSMPTFSLAVPILAMVGTLALAEVFIRGRGKN